MNKNLTPEERAQEILKNMTLDEKFTMLYGVPGNYQGNIPKNSRLGIPELRLEDGPQGVSDNVKNVTAYPSALTVTATFDRKAAYQFAKAMAEEQKIKGTNVQLGPMMNIARAPLDGRNFESLGEDTYLSGEMAFNIITGIQDQGIIACAKHFAMANQEYNISSTSVEASQRTFYEVYVPQFRRSVEAGVGSVMCSYNRVNQTHNCENDGLLNVALKQKLQFKGWVMSDWGATHSSSFAANSGLDQQMPDDSFFNQQLKKDLSDGKITQARIDDMVYRILFPMFKLGIFDRPQNGSLDAEARSPEHTRIAKELASNSTVLLKNINNALPLDMGKILNIALLGDGGRDKPLITGGGSGQVDGSPIITPYDAILKAFNHTKLKIDYANSSQNQLGLKYAQQCDVAIIFAGISSSEGGDRGNLSLGIAQEQFILQVSQIQKRKRTIVVLNVPGPILMANWVDSVQAVLVQFLPGQEYGNSIYEILFGIVSPSGRLPITMPQSETQVPVNTVQQYPGVNDNVTYSEGLFVGYKWYDKNNIQPLFPFGFGLSYTTFQYYNISISLGNESTCQFKLTVTIRNTGNFDGAESVQMYLGMPSELQEPLRQLRGFEKIYLTKNSSSEVNFCISNRTFEFWNTNIQNYDIFDGDYVFYVGAGSRDLKLAIICNLIQKSTLQSCRQQDLIQQIIQE